MNNECNFTYKHYSDCLQQFLVNGFTPITVKKFYENIDDRNCISDSRKKLILRHDVDHDICLIEGLANIEYDRGIASSIYLRLRAKNYNLFSKKSKKIIDKLVRQGHELGFHYDSDDLEDSRLANILSLLRSEWGDDQFRTISPHEPTRNPSNMKVSLEKHKILGDAYSPRILKNVKYISDSSCHWREGCMHNFINNPQSVYILTHPIWWFQDSPGECY